MAKFLKMSRCTRIPRDSATFSTPPIQDRDGLVSQEELAKEILRRAFLGSILTHEQMLAAYRAGNFGAPFPVGTVH